MRLFATTVLLLEPLLVLFAALVAKDLTDVPDRLLWPAAGALAALCLASVALLRFPLGYGVGSVVQVLLLASGLVVPGMLLLGVLFTGLWGTALVLGARVDREKAQRQAQSDVG